MGNSTENILIKKINIKFLITIFGLITPAVAYIMGITFYEGGLSAYGVNSELFKISIQDIYVNAYYAVGHILRDITESLIGMYDKLSFSKAAIILVVLTICFYVVFFLSKKKIKHNNKTLNKIFLYLNWKKNDLIKAIGTTCLTVFIFISSSYLLMFIAFFWLILPGLAYFKSVDISEKKRTDFIDNGCYIKGNEFWNNCRILKSETDEIIYKGILISENNDYIAFFTEEGAVVAPRPKGAVIARYFKNSVYKDQ